MDALKLNMLFAENEGAAVCLFGKQLHPNQLGLLQSLIKHYKQVRVVLDTDAKADAMSISNQVALITQCKPLFLTGVKDPGELDAGSFMQAFSKFRNAVSSAL